MAKLISTAIRPQADRLRLFLMPLAAAMWFTVCGSAEALGQEQRDDQRSDASPATNACFETPSYVVFRTTAAIQTDGRLEEAEWEAARWMSDFVDMAENSPPAREQSTRVKMLWDDDALYVAARLDEPHVWATLTERDTRIYLDNAFEVFIDPDGDTHQYYELEVNALGTLWDLMLIKPYRDGGPFLSAWDIRGLEVGIGVDGTLNDPTDLDEGWRVEMALPWAVLAEAAPHARAPQAGEQWRMNFSRSHWPFETADGEYRKLPAASAAWSSWSPQGEYDIHMPECWGFVQFADVPAGNGEVSFVEDPNEQLKRALRRLYYRQRAYRDTNGRYADSIADLSPDDVAVEGRPFEPQLRTTQTTYEITTRGANGGTVHIGHDGRVWTTAE